MRSEAIRVVVGDAHPLFRDAIARAIRTDPRLELASAAASAWAALHDIARLAPDVAVLDPGPDIEALLRAFGPRDAAARLILLTARVDGALTVGALAGGAAAVLSKDLDGEEVCGAIAAVVRGETVLAPEAQRCVAAELRARGLTGRTRLTEREQQVLAGIAGGRKAPDIAEDLHLGTATIKTHLMRLYEKLGVSERAAAVAAAMREGLLE